MLVPMSDREGRQARAEARRHGVALRKTTLESTEEDAPIRGAAGMSLVMHLTRESWALSGREEPRYTRAEIPCRFVPQSELSASGLSAAEKAASREP